MEIQVHFVLLLVIENAFNSHVEYFQLTQSNQHEYTEDLECGDNQGHDVKVFIPGHIL